MSAVTQKHLFDPSRPIEPCDPHVAEADKPRLRGQNGKLLDRLRQGPASTAELRKDYAKYTSRISDVRKVVERNGGKLVAKKLQGGNWEYRLHE